MGLLDMWNQGKNWASNQDWSSNRVDPGANAQALMGGTPMNPQGLLNNVYGEGTDTFKNETGIVDPSQPYVPPTFTQNSPYTPEVVNTAQSPYGSAPQQGITGNGSGIDFNQSTPTWGSGYEAPTGPTELEKAAEQERRASLMNPSLVSPYGSQQQQGIIAPGPELDSYPDQYNTPVDNTNYGQEAQVEVGQPTVTTSPNPGFQWPWEAFGNQQTMEEKIRAQAIARQKLIDRGLISPK